MKRLSVLLGLAGVSVVVGLLDWADAGAVWAAVRGVGWGGLLALVLFQGGLFALLGTAWAVVVGGMRPGWGLWRLLVWGRAVRDSATTCLPFSPVGGFVIGARAVTLEGMAWPVAAAGTVVDVTAEILAQMVFALGGVGVLGLVRPGSGLAGPVGAGVGAALGLLLLLVWQRAAVGRLVRLLGRRLLGEWFAGAERLQGELGRLFVPGRVVVAGVVHLSGWVATGVWTWLALWWLGSGVGLVPILAMEALLDALVAAAFLVPGAAGVQEAGYVGFGLLFGVPAELALGVSLLRRGKDLVWGVPVLGAWQWREWRRAR